MQGDNEDIYIELQLSEGNMNIAKEEGLVKKFKLTKTIGTYKGSWFHVYHHRNN